MVRYPPLFNSLSNIKSTYLSFSYLGKVPLRCTPHFVAYHLESKTYAVVTSTSEATEKVWKFNGDDKELVTEERDERFPWPLVDSFQYQLFSPISWEAIPGKGHFFSDYGLRSGYSTNLPPQRDQNKLRNLLFFLSFRHRMQLNGQRAKLVSVRRPVAIIKIWNSETEKRKVP